MSGSTEPRQTNNRRSQWGRGLTIIGGAPWRAARIASGDRSPPLLLLAAALDVAGHATGDAADRRTRPGVAAGDRRDPGAGRGTDGRAAHRALLLRGHVGAAHAERQAGDARDPSKRFHEDL